MAYKPPTAKTSISKYLCFRGSCSEARPGIGRAKIARSVAIRNPAMENHSAIVF